MREINKERKWKKEENKMKLHQISCGHGMSDTQNTFCVTVQVDKACVEVHMHLGNASSGRHSHHGSEANR